MMVIDDKTIDLSRLVIYTLAIEEKFMEQTLLFPISRAQVSYQLSSLKIGWAITDSGPACNSRSIPASGTRTSTKSHFSAATIFLHHATSASEKEIVDCHGD